MVDQVAGITLKADASQIQQAAEALNKFAQSGKVAETQVESLASATAKTGGRAKEAAQAIGAQAQAVGAVAKGQDAATAAIQATADAYQAQIKAGNDAIANMRQERQLSRDRVTSLQAEKAVLQEQAKLSNDGATAARARIQAINLEIAAERQKAAALNQSITAERQSIETTKAQAAALTAQSSAMTRNARLAEQLGTSQKNLAFASRNAVFQLQDIAVSLDMGMPVYRVLLQQVPQVTGAFGGFGNTLKYVAALLGPVGLALSATAAVLGTMAIMSSRSERTMSDLNKTLALTNGYSGLTADSIIRMGENADHAGRSFTKTVDTVKALAAAGVAAGADFENLAKVANDFASKSGIGIDEVVAQLAKLSSDPVGGLRALQDQYHGITEAQIQHVKQLQEQGRQSEAVAAANTAAASSFAKMSSDITSNAGTLERAMGSVARAAKSMWDAILDIGRPTSANDKEMEVRERLQRATTAYNVEMKALSEQNGKYTAGQRERIQMLANEVDMLGKQTAAFTKAAQGRRDEAKAATEKAQAQEKDNALTRDAATLLDTYKSKANQRNAELARAKRLLDAGKISEKEYGEVVKEINERLKDPAPAKQKQIQVDQGVKMLEDARAQLAVLRQTQSVQSEATGQGQRERAIRQDIIKLEQDAIALQARAASDRLTKSEQQQLSEIKATIQIKEKSALEAKRLDNLEKANKAHAQTEVYLTATKAQIAGIAEGYAMSADAAGDLAKRLELVDRLQRAGASQEDIAKAQKAFDELIEAQSGNAATLYDGFSRGMEDSLKSMGNGYTQMQSLTKSTVDTMTDTFATFFETGKFGAMDMVNAIIKELIRLATNSAFKSFAAMFGAGAGSGGSLFGDIFKGLTASANGNVMSGGNLSAYSGMIIDQPTLFNFGQLHKFANGAGLMGEAGPEAVMPLRRGKDGKLGVATSGGAGGTYVDVSVVFQQGGGASVTSSGNNAAAQSWAEGLTQTIRSEIVKAKEPGGPLYQPM